MRTQLYGARIPQTKIQTSLSIPDTMKTRHNCTIRKVIIKNLEGVATDQDWQLMILLNI